MSQRTDPDRTGSSRWSRTPDGEDGVVHYLDTDLPSTREAESHSLPTTLTLESSESHPLLASPHPLVPSQPYTTVPLYQDPVWLEPTPDLFTNTSLETRRSPPRRNPGRARIPSTSRPSNPHSASVTVLPIPRHALSRLSPHRGPTRSTLRIEAAEQAEIGARATHNRSADRRVDRLNAWRLKENILIPVFKIALMEFKRDDPIAFVSFLAHMENSALAAKTAVRSFAIMAWFPNLPPIVSATLNGLISFYHGEATQTVDVYLKERQAGSWTDVDDLDGEIIYASNNTTIRPRGTLLEVLSFRPFGAGDDGCTPLRCPGFLAVLFKDEAKLHEDTVRALAVCRVACTFLDSNAGLRDPTDGRWEEALADLISLCETTVLIMQNSADWVNKPGVTLADVQHFANAIVEIKWIGREAQFGIRFGKIAMGRALAVKYAEENDRLVQALEDNSENVVALRESCEEMAGRLIELEEGDGGVGPVFGTWKELRFDGKWRES